MEINRRQFCKSLVAFAGATTLPGCTSVKQSYASACISLDNKYFIAKLDENGHLITQVEIPIRGHDIAQVPGYKNRVLAFSRRPGTKIFNIDLATGQLINTINAAPGRHFYGHGIYSTDGKYLYTPENDFAQQLGKIVVRDGKTLSVLAEYDSGGIGPHQCAMLSDGKTLVIANGGIATHPDTARKKLNLSTMAPNLTYLDVDTGEIMDKFLPPNAKLSIRHLAVSNQDQVVIGMQYQGEKQDKIPLIYSQQGNQALKAFKCKPDIWAKMAQYTASVCIDNGLNIAAVTAPKGDFVSYWDLTNHQYIGDYASSDCAGISLADDGFMLSNGKGALERIAALAQYPIEKQNIAGLRWDNHMIRLK